MIYMHDWLYLHPYKGEQPSDSFFVELANRLNGLWKLKGISEEAQRKVCLYLAAYLEDQISDLHLWQTFLAEHERLYGRVLPFYETGADYLKDEVNVEDVCFILWNAWEKEIQHIGKEIPGTEDLPAYVNPMNASLLEQAKKFYAVLEEAYEVAPENPVLNDFFKGFDSLKEADGKLNWLFGRTYLTEPALLPYIANVSPSDRFIIPTGPLALFLSEWIDALGGGEQWKQVEGLYVAEPELPEEYAMKNQIIYQKFTTATGGSNIVFLNGYEELKRFLIEGLHWPDDESHTLPQLKPHRNFILMVNPDKGMLLAKDICQYLAAPGNVQYNKVEAQQSAFSMLTEETVCPPDLLVRSITEGWLPDLRLPGEAVQGESNELVVRNADFIARHALLYYYRGD